jgi:ribosomal protein S18 acetylase RimI-like enzyme
VTIWVGTATADDIPDILASADALVAMDAGVHDAAGTNVGWASETGVAYVTSLLASDDNLVLLARDDDEPVGHLVGRLGGPGSVHPIRVADLQSIDVYPAHRGQGATVTAYAANDGAQHFYARHGFAVRSVILDLDDLPQ